MNDLIKEDFIPSVAIVVYSQDGGQNYLESRKIVNKNNCYQMLEGVPLTKKLLGGMLEEIDPQKLHKINCEGFLPKNLLHYSNKNVEANMIWYIKSSNRNLTFSKGLGIKDGVMHLPTLVFKLKGNGLSMYAAKTNNVTEKTKLYRAPFHNIFDNGGVCMGNSRVIKSTNVKKLMKGWEDGFFMSKFSHLQSGGSPIKGNLNTFINEQIKGKKLFDRSVLLDINKTVEDLL